MIATRRLGSAWFGQPVRSSFRLDSSPAVALTHGTYEPTAGPVKLPRPFPCGSLGLSLDRALALPPGAGSVPCRKAPMGGA
jgi:hypothetical protein